MFADSYSPLLRAIEDAARTLREEFEAADERGLDVNAIMAAQANLELAWTEYTGSRGLLFEL